MRKRKSRPMTRSEIMRAVGRENTAPEKKVQRVLETLGIEFRTHAKDLPGTPDIAFDGLKKCIFVHGCFWHRHEGCPRATMPKTRTDFWRMKFERNKERDERKIRELEKAGWEVLVVWECETVNEETLKVKLYEFLRRP